MSELVFTGTRTSFRPIIYFPEHDILLTTMTNIVWRICDTDIAHDVDDVDDIAHDVDDSTSLEELVVQFRKESAITNQKGKK